MFAFGVYGLCGYVSDLVWLLMVFCFVGGVLFVGGMIGFWVRVAWGLVCGDCGFDLNCWKLGCIVGGCRVCWFVVVFAVVLVVWIVCFVVGFYCDLRIRGFVGCVIEFLRDFGCGLMVCFDYCFVVGLVA